MDFLSWPKGDDESRVYQTSPLVFSSNTRAFSARSGVECYDGGVNGKEKASQGYIYIYIRRGRECRWGDVKPWLSCRLARPPKCIETVTNGQGPAVFPVHIPVRVYPGRIVDRESSRDGNSLGWPSIAPLDTIQNEIESIRVGSRVQRAKEFINSDGRPGLWGRIEVSRSCHIPVF